MRKFTSPRPAFGALPLLLLSLSTSPGCFLFPVDAGASGPAVVELDAPLHTDHALAIGVLRLVNDADTEVAWLVEDLHLDPGAAEGLVDQRQGPDGLDFTDDDDLYEDLQEVLAVPRVGEVALSKLEHGAQIEGLVPIARIDEVYFSREELTDTLDLVNEAERTLLDREVGLRSDAASSLVARRPFESIQDAADAPNVGPATLRALRDYSAGR